jgi:Na+-translocating ferredoxin:NAD+ oxidoreductase RnfG subunit
MKFILLMFSLILSAHGANKPYNEVIAELHPKKCEKIKENIYLNKEQMKLIEEQSQTKIYGGLALRYISQCPNGEKLYHYVDSHIVRTLNQTVVVTIQNNSVKKFVVSSFSEPPEYKAPQKWYDQFIGKSPKKVLKPRADIDALSGATLTVNSSISAVNKILFMHQLLQK